MYVLFMCGNLAPGKKGNINRKYDIMFFVDTLFYLISLFSFAFGILNLGFLLFIKQNTHDRGAWTLSIPLIPLILITVLLVFEYYLEYRYPGRRILFVVLLFEWSRLAVAFSWNFITYYHYAINRVEVLKRRAIYFIAAVCLGIAAAVPFILYFKPACMPVLYAAVVLLLYHAGIRAILILRKGRKLYPSTKAALAVAVISLLVYPAIGIGDPLGWRLPFLNPGMSLWVQGHPLYFAVANIPFTLFIIKSLKRSHRASFLTETQQKEFEGQLSLREIEVLELLLLGYSYKRIAEALFISLPTVKTHVQHIYFKLDVKRRVELFLKLGRA